MPATSITGTIAKTPQSTQHTILLADDDALVREMFSCALEESGFQVIKASDGFEAYSLFIYAPDQIDLLVSDVLMPKMNGIDAYRKMRGIKPYLPAILMSGYSDGIDIYLKDGDITPEFMTKPLRPDRLISRIHELLDEH